MNQQQDPHEVRSSPWRQPIVWLMVALVGATVIGSFILLDIASSDGPQDVVRDEVQRTGQAQQTDLGPDARAADRKLAAILRFDTEQGFVEVLPVGGDFGHAQTLTLQLSHPARAANDVTLTLAATDTGWRTQRTLGTDHDWLIQLTPAQGNAWRLRGRLPHGQLATQLRPALDSPQP